MNTVINFLFAGIKAGTPLLFGTTGEILTEKAGNLNLGVEGMMAMGAIAGFYTGYTTGNVLLSLVAAFLAGAFGALVYAFITVTMKANQTVTGLALTIFGVGVGDFFGRIMISNSPDGTPKLPDNVIDALAQHPIPILSDIPVLGKLLFSHNPMVYIGIAVALLIWGYLRFTKWGLATRAVGENPYSADSAGINVSLYKYVNICIGGGVCGLGGAYIALINGGGVWNTGCVNGLGWISAALVIFAAWSPFKAILGSLVFGSFTVLQYYVPKDVIQIPNAFYVMLPFVITATVLVVSSVRQKKEGAQPLGCSNNFFREER